MSNPSLRSFRILAAVGLAAALGALVVPSPSVADDVIPIAEALDTAKTYDFVMIEGVVTDKKGQGLFRIEDESGDMIVLIKDHTLREEGPIDVHDRLRLWGRIEEKKLDRDKRGMMVSRVYRQGEKVGATGKNDAGAAADAAVVPIDRSALPAAPAISGDAVMKPHASEQFVARARAKVQAYREAEAAAVEAGQAYARVARDSASSEADQAAALERVETAEARVVELRGQFPALLDEARAQGLDQGVISMIEQTAGLR